MKTKIILLIIICGTWCACEDNRILDTNNSVAVAGVVDFTDTKILWQHAEQILPLFPLNVSPDIGCKFWLSAISDKQINPTFESELPNSQITKQWNHAGDAQFRKRCIIHFQDMVRADYQKLYQTFDTNRSCKYSECMAGISSALHFLQASQCSKKYLIITSDLMQKANWLNAYKLVANESAATLANQLAKRAELPPNLRGVTIIFLFQPRNRSEDEGYSKMLDAYKLLLEPKGALIEVKSTTQQI